MTDGWSTTDAAYGGGDGGAGGSSGCRKCGEDGHMAKECSIPDKCRKCNEEGHMARDCTIPDTCNKCKEEGHMSKDCHLPDKCRKCNEEGHLARDCSIPDKCFKCKEEGHMSKDCHLPDTCRRCGAEGHMSRDCTEEEKTRTYVGEDGEEREIYVPKMTKDEDLWTTINTGINFDKYDNIQVDVKGDKVPKPIVDFKNSGLRQLVIDNILKSKYTVPTPVQKHTIPIIKAKRDLMACSQTGSGKTAAFLLPIVSNLLEEQADPGTGSSIQRPQVVIMTPTRELAIQIRDQARKFAMGSTIKSVVVYGGTSSGSQLGDLERGCNILVATAGRLLDFVERGRISFERLQYFILDEADRMLDDGFGPHINKCMSNPTMPSKENRTTLMFSATFPTSVEGAAREYLKKDKIFLGVGLVGAACSDVKQEFYEVSRKEKKDKVLEILNDPQRNPSDRCIIFVNQKKQADFLATLLCQRDLPASTMNGDRKQREREEVLHDFKIGKRPILVATNVASRGLDIPDVQQVVNYDMPNDVDEYVHRIGRTGRVGNIGRAYSFFDRDQDSSILGPLCDMLGKCGVEVPSFMSGGDVFGFGDDGAGAPAAAAAEDDDEW